MNWEQIEGNWRQMAGKVREKWGKLTDDDLTAIAGRREQLAGLLQQRYGIAKEIVDRQLDDFTRSLAVKTKPATDAASVGGPAT